ncbi:MAG: zinc-binding dehydrogenase [Anaerolineaceae bacterium]|nr:zinc-binding dehydrogenase [Anaerolineaceae bacterium]
MQALVKYDSRPDAVELRDIPEPPDPGPNDVILEVRAAGVCGSDLHMWQENHSWEISLPLVLGHEFCGLVAAVGTDVTKVRPGDRVACETAAQICNQCSYCLGGAYNLCPGRLGYGALADGAFTRFVTARQEILHTIPEGVPFAHAALTEPVCVAYNALVEKTAIMKPGDTVVIQGAGTIGIMALLVTRLRGASEIIVLGTDVDEHRLGVAAELGASRTINIQQEDPVDYVLSRGDCFGADLVVDCSGVSVALEQAMAMVRPNGLITKIGWGPQPLGFNLDPLVGKAVTLQGSFSHTYNTWERVLGLMGSGQLNLDPVIGGQYPLTDWHSAFEHMESGRNVKSVLVL